MPIYEFKCRKCGETFDVLFRSRDEKLAVACPKCKSTRTQRHDVRLRRKDRKHQRRRGILRELRSDKLQPYLRSLNRSRP